MFRGHSNLPWARWVGLAALAAVTAPAYAGETFSQVDWLNQTGGFQAQNSEWGLVDLTLTNSEFAQLTPFSGGFYGFLNVVTNTGTGVNWAVQNKIIIVANPTELTSRGTEEIPFNLGTARGQHVSGLQYGVSITPAAVASPGIAANQSFSVN